MPTKLAHMVASTGEFFISLTTSAAIKILFFLLALGFCSVILLLVIAAFVNSDLVTGSLAQCGSGFDACRNGISGIVAFGWKEVKVFLNL